MKKILLFPYHHDIEVLVENRGYLIGYELIGIISYKEDMASVMELNSLLGITDNENDDSLIRKCDMLIILDNYRQCKSEKYYRIIDYALSLNKDVVITPLAARQLDLDKYTGQYKILQNLPECIQECTTEIDKKLFDIDIPVIGIVGQGSYCDKFRNHMMLNQIIGREYNVLSITSNSLGALFGCYTIPDFVFSDGQFEEKIFRFNHYVRRLVEEKQYDVIILGIPEGIMPFERQEYHHFGEYPLIVSTAVTIDIAILCTYFLIGDKLEYGLTKMVEYCENKFNIPIGLVAVSRVSFEVPYDEHEKIFFEYFNKEFLEKYYPHIGNLPMIDVTSIDKAEEAINGLLSTLQDNIEVI